MSAGQSSLIDLVKMLRAGVLYFAIVFGIGFLLGIIRVAFVIPRIGARAAELVEAPIMIAACYLTARILVRKLAIPFSWTNRLGIGLTGFVLMLVAELGLVLWLRGMSFAEYFSTRDPLTTAVYYVSLLLFALMPLIVKRSTV